MNNSYTVVERDRMSIINVLHFGGSFVTNNGSMRLLTLNVSTEFRYVGGM